MSLAGCVTAADVRGASARLSGQVVRTPVIRGGALEEQPGVGRVLLKLEPLQVTGSFKFRGAANALATLPAERRSAGVVAYSSGNHARAVATAAARLGVRAVIIMPTNAPAMKRAATEAALSRAPSGSRVVTYDPGRVVREALGRELSEREGLTLIPPYDDPAVIAGQGTVGLELAEQVEEAEGRGLDEVYVCCGGGGLLSGVAIAVKERWPGCRVSGVEPEVANDAKRSFESGVLHVVSNPPTIADGTRTPYLGRLTFPLVRAHVDEMMDVSEEEIAAAVRLCVHELKVVVEPSGALGVAGLLKAARAGVEGKGVGARVGVVVSGGNVDVERLAEVCAMADWPG